MIGLSKIQDFLVLSRVKAAALENIEADLAATKKKSIAVIDAAAADIGDTPSFYFGHRVADTAVANSVYVDDMMGIRSDFLAFGKWFALFIAVALWRSVTDRLADALYEITKFRPRIGILFTTDP